MTNPGCYPTAAVALLRPLTDAGLLPADYQLVIQPVSGYSGHGRAGAEAYEAGRTGQIVLSAVLDNLGKGAAGAAVQNLRLMAQA